MRYKLILSSLLGLALWTGTTLAAGPDYRLGVDGLACPFCAYGIEKQLGSIAGVRELNRQKLHEVEAHVAQLKTLRNELTLLLNLCMGSEDGCHIIENLDKTGSPYTHGGCAITTV